MWGCVYVHVSTSSKSGICCFGSKRPSLPISHAGVTRVFVLTSVSLIRKYTGPIDLFWSLLSAR